MSVRCGLGCAVVAALLLLHVDCQWVKYKYLDEYLLHLERRQRSILIQEIEIKVAADPSPLRTGYRHDKDSRCCLLGQLAGEKGFHCMARFYAARILHRNYNRAHNKKIRGLLRGRPDRAVDKLMRTFEQCVAHRGGVFHKCCRHAALDAP